jgi:TetR/AcrR family transcriptional repressor of bet genes
LIADKASEAADSPVPERQVRRAPKALRREQLINATIDSLAFRGYAATTLADVAEGAGLSRGIVNFHFESKDNLLVETLQHLAEDYTSNWRLAVAEAGESAASKMRAVLVSDLNDKICTPRLVAAWFAFYTEAKARPAYQELSWGRDGDYYSTLVSVCATLKAEGAYRFDPERIAAGVYAMQEGLWLRLMIESALFDRELALSTALATAGTLFPLHFDEKGNIHEAWKKMEKFG